VTVNDSIKDDALKAGYSKHVHVYPMGIDTKHFTPDKYNFELKSKINPEGPIILFIGSVIYMKGIQYLMHAMKYIVKEFPLAKLVVIGEGNLKIQMVQLSKSLGITDNVIFKGRVPYNELPSYYATSDLFILPSLSEGWPVVVMEALSTGIITVVTDLPVFLNIENKEKLFLVIKKKSETDIYNCIISVFKNKTKYSKMNQFARDYAVKYFDWNVVSNNYLLLINRLNNDERKTDFRKN
jgi:glycosyltransferase involved in cell wall biosynthesis